MAQMVSSDRNAYDRCYFNAHGRSGEPFLVTGLGIYPNLGIIDAYATVRVGDRQLTVRASDAIDGHDRLTPAVGPFRIEVIEPLERLRFTCDGDDHGVGFDLTWQGSFPAVDEEPHVWRSGHKLMLHAQRFAQMGSWEGELRVDGVTHEVDPGTWLGSRDRSWGIRPSGEPEPPARAAEEPIEGFWWLYVPLRFEDFTIIVIVQEDPDGHRVLNDAVRLAGGRRAASRAAGLAPGGDRLPQRHPRAHGRHHPPDRARRHPAGARGRVARLRRAERGDGLRRRPDVDPRLLARPGLGRGRRCGPHRSGRGLDAPVRPARPRRPGAHRRRRGWGLFEHGTFGRHDPSGFADWGSVAP